MASSAAFRGATVVASTAAASVVAYRQCDARSPTSKAAVWSRLAARSPQHLAPAALLFGARAAECKVARQKTMVDVVQDLGDINPPEEIVKAVQKLNFHDILLQDPLFSLLSAKAAKELTSDPRNKMWCRSGDILLCKGRANDTLYVVGAGDVNVMVNRDHTVKLSAPAFVGEISVVMGGKAQATVTVASDYAYVCRIRRTSLLDRIDQETFDKLEEMANGRILQNVSQNIIRRVPIFEKASNEFISAASKLLRFVEYEEDDIVLQEGKSDNEGMFFIKSGEVCVEMKSRGDEQVRARLYSGSFFGEQMLVRERKSQQPAVRAATVYAGSYVEMLQLTQQDFNKLVEQFPAEYEGFVATAERRHAENKE